jgi:hypothetical protein
MPTPTELPTLSDLPWLPYLTEAGAILEEFQGKIGVYAIFDEDRVLQFVGYSRDVFLSLKQHLVRQCDRCHWLKVQTIDRPSRTLLEDTRQHWLTEVGIAPDSNTAEEALWTEPIDATQTMSDREREDFEKTDGLGQIKLLKNVARRVEADILHRLQQRGVTTEIRFNPKLKEKGLLDLK